MFHIFIFIVTLLSKLIYILFFTNNLTVFMIIDKNQMVNDRKKIKLHNYSQKMDLE